MMPLLRKRYGPIESVLNEQEWMAADIGHCRCSASHQCSGLVFRESADTEMAGDSYLEWAVWCVEIVQSPSRETNPVVSVTERQGREGEV